MNLEERRQGLLQLVEDFRERECRRILGAARAEATQLIDRTYRKQRARLHERILAERVRARARIQAVRAEQATRERLAEEHGDFVLLESAWPLVRERLLAQWRRAEARRLWVETYLHRALDLLPSKEPWTIRHACEWNEQEREAVLAALPGLPDRSPDFVGEEGIEAGLIIASGGTMLDAGLQGLLWDRAHLQARLLALVETRDHTQIPGRTDTG